MNSKPWILASMMMMAMQANAAIPDAQATDRAQQTAATSAPAKASALRDIPATLLDHMEAHRYAQAWAMFDTEFQAQVSAERLGDVWDSLPAGTSRGEPLTKMQGDTTITLIPLVRGEAHFKAVVAVNPNGRVTGFVVQPAQEAAPAPEVAADASFTERDFSVGSGPDALPATLAIPKGKGPFPAVVLVHGSGAHDRDETIGPNRPFLDIARGLAAQGIAVLRYDKRNKVQPDWYKTHPLTIDTQTTDDAVTALATLRGIPDIDARRVFVLGHSLGAMMAPRIAARDGRLAGAILLAAPARKLMDIVIEQNERLAKLDDGVISPEEARHIAQIRSQVAAMRSPIPATDKDSLLGAPQSLWKTVDAVDPIAEAGKLHLPMLLLQGGRDIQVVDADWSLWRTAFGKDHRVTMKHYPALNHLGIAGTGPGNLAEYGVPGHVDAALIKDVAAWIKAH